jgi:hypothetical protein
MVAGFQSAKPGLQMNHTNTVLLWVMINFLWSAILVVASGWLYVLSRQLERDRQTYQKFIRRQENKERNNRKL